MQMSPKKSQLQSKANDLNLDNKQSGTRNKDVYPINSSISDIYTYRRNATTLSPNNQNKILQNHLP